MAPLGRSGPRRWRRRGGRRRDDGRRHALLAAGVDGPQRGGVQKARLGDAEIGLEGTDGGDRRLRVPAVDRAGVVAECGQFLLQLGHAGAQRGRSRAQPGPQRSIRGLVVLACLGQPEISLQRPDGIGGRLVEDARDVALVVPQHLEHLLQLGRHHRGGEDLLLTQGDEVDLVGGRLDELALDDARRRDPRRRHVAAASMSSPPVTPV